MLRTYSSLFALLMAVASLLGGCAYAPGLSIGRSVSTPGAQTNPYSITTQRSTQSTPGAAADGGVDAPPPGTITPITVELVRQQRAAQKVAVQSNDAETQVARLFGVAKPYAIGLGDVLNIAVWEHPELVSGAGSNYLVGDDGKVWFPYIGHTQLSGLTVQAANALIAKGLAEYIKDPQVILTVQSYRSKSVYVDGAVAKTGLQPVDNLTPTLPVVLSNAGGLKADADRTALLLTRDGVATRINLKRLVERGINPSNIMLASGDMLYVPSTEEERIFVLGEIPRVGKQFLRNGSLTLGDALGDAGGINPGTGDPRQIYVIRKRDIGNPQIFHLDARTAVGYALAEDFDLKARDVVFVDPMPIVSWNRVISLILPSAGAANLTRSTVNNFAPNTLP